MRLFTVRSLVSYILFDWLDMARVQLQQERVRRDSTQCKFCGALVPTKEIQKYVVGELCENSTHSQAGEGTE
jgi:hypothetical protein